MVPAVPAAENGHAASMATGIVREATVALTRLVLAEPIDSAAVLNDADVIELVDDQDMAWEVAMERPRTPGSSISPEILYPGGDEVFGAVGGMGAEIRRRFLAGETLLQEEAAEEAARNKKDQEVASAPRLSTPEPLKQATVGGEATSTGSEKADLVLPEFTGANQVEVPMVAEAVVPLPAIEAPEEYVPVMPTAVQKSWPAEEIESVIDFGPNWTIHAPPSYRNALTADGWTTSECGRYMFRPYIRVAKHWFTGAVVKSDAADAVALTKKVGTATACRPTGTVPKKYRIPKRQGDEMSEGDVSPPQIRAVMASVVHNVSWQTGGNSGGRNGRTAGEKKELPGVRPPNPFATRRSMSNGSVSRQATSAKTAVVTRPGGQKPPPRASTKTPLAPRTCFACGAVENHPIQYCREWRGYTLKQRQLVVRHHNRCPNCLKAQHPPPCWGGSCPHCPGRLEHNSWLCPVMEQTMQKQKQRPGERK